MSGIDVRTGRTNNEIAGRALRLGLYGEQDGRMNILQMPEYEQLRIAADPYCEFFPPVPPTGAKEIRDSLGIGLGRKARTESVTTGRPPCHSC